MTITLGASDLAYLLRNVRIGTDYSQLSGPLDPSGVREVSGHNNNLVGGYDQNGVWVPASNVNADWGQADTDFLQLSHTDTPGSANHWGTSYGPVTVVPGTNAADPFANLTVDATPRLISNLITSSVIDPTSSVFNPAAVAAMNAIGNGYTVDVNNSVVGASQGAGMPDQGILGGVPFNEFFVAFGQFFDHGLDFISKGGGYVMIPLSPGDPLYVDPSDPAYIPGASNMMMLNRASLSNPDSDFNPDGTLKDGVTPTFNNNTGLLIDQSQTYGSEASVNALLRQYDANGTATGQLITNAEDGLAWKPELDANGNRVVNQYGQQSVYSVSLTDPANAADLEAARHDLATWADLKANALRIGVDLVDMDVLDAPALRVDATGALLFDSSAVFAPGGERVVFRASETLAETAARYGVDPATLEAHDPFARGGDGHVLHSNQAILADMGFGANPAGSPGFPGGYDPALLDRHYVSGDGRVNENVGLTAVHHIFHEEHNIQARSVEDSVLQQAASLAFNGDGAAATAYVADWTRASGTTGTVHVDYVDAAGAHHDVAIDGVALDGSGVAFDGDMVFQAARIITETEYNHVAVDQYVGGFVGLPEFVSYSADINCSVSLEFAQAVFRLGHSMLTEQLQIAVADANGNGPGTAGWEQTFVNEDLFDGFLNPDVYSEYGAAGITIGLMRQTSNAIDEFVTPALQQSLLGTPLDLAALNIARGRDVGLPTLNELREQIYQQYVQLNGSSGSGSAIAPYTSWADFGAHLRTPESLVNFMAAYARDTSSDPAAHDWGISEARAAYMAGDTNPGTGAAWTLADIRAKAQAVIDAYNDPADPLHADAVQFMFGTPVYNPLTHSVEAQGADQGFWDVDLWLGGLAERPLFDGPLGTTFSMIMLDFGQRMQEGDRFYYLYRMPVGHHLGDQIISEQFADLIQRTTGTQHTGDAFGSQSAFYELDDGNNVWQSHTAGTLPDGVTPVQDGHIVVAGNGGHDYIAGGLGDDYLYGDEGDDTLNGSQGNDHLYGGAGNDWITDDENDDFIDGGEGNDTIFAGPGVLDTSHGGRGNDEVHGGDGVDEVFGDDGDDSLYGEGDTDLMMGGDGNDYLDGGDSVDEMFGGNGNDWLRGGVGDDNLNGGSGNDLMEGGLGPSANDGDRLNGDSPATLGGTVIEFNGDGTQGDMDIASYEEAMIRIFASLQDSNANGSNSNLADTYAYVEGLVGSQYADILTGADANTSTSNGANNYLVGGGGGDIIDGLGGNDRIFGDIATVTSDLYAVDDPRNIHGAVVGTIAAQGELRPVFADGTVGHFLGQGVDGDDVLSGGAGDDIIMGRGGNDTIAGGADDDILYGEGGADILNGGAGSDTLYGGNGGDTVSGGEGNDRLYSGGGSSDALDGGGGDDLFYITATNVTATGGLGNDVYSVTAGATGTLVENADEGVDRVVSGRNFTLGAHIEHLTLSGSAVSGTGNELANIIVGNGIANTLRGMGGNDAIRAGAGNDTIIQVGGTDGRDTINGELGTDTYQLETAGGQSYHIWTRAYAASHGVTGLAAGTEIVVMLGGTNASSVIAQLTSIEEIVVNSNSSGATIDVKGDFNTTSLHYNTITINGASGQDVVDISGLTSEHRIVFTSNGGADQVIGTLRPQDVVDGGVAVTPVSSPTSLPAVFEPAFAGAVDRGAFLPAGVASWSQPGAEATGFGGWADNFALARLDDLGMHHAIV